MPKIINSAKITRESLEKTLALLDWDNPAPGAQFKGLNLVQSTLCQHFKTWSSHEPEKPAQLPQLCQVPQLLRPLPPQLHSILKNLIVPLQLTSSR